MCVCVIQGKNNQHFKNVSATVFISSCLHFVFGNKNFALVKQHKCIKKLKS